MQKYLLLSIFFVASIMQAQVKIGDNPTMVNPDAVLDLESSNRGLVYPRVALTATTIATPLSAHVAGMTVYNTATAGDVTPGLYVNDGTKWTVITTSTAAPASSVSAVCNGFSGTYAPGTATRTFSITYTNNTFAAVTIANATGDLVLSPASGLTVASRSPASSTIASGATAVVTYTLGGTLAAPAGTVITGTFKKLALTCSTIVTTN